MKLKRIGILVFAAAVLMAMTGGTAFAATVTYSDTLSTTIYYNGGTYPNSFSVSKNADATGNRAVTVGDTVQWYNDFYNNLGIDIAVGVSQYTSPLYGLNYNTETFGVYHNNNLLNQIYSTGVAVDGSHTICARHMYTDTWNGWPSDYDTSMTYT